MVPIDTRALCCLAAILPGLLLCQIFCYITDTQTSGKLGAPCCSEPSKEGGVVASVFHIENSFPKVRRWPEGSPDRNGSEDGYQVQNFVFNGIVNKSGHIVDLFQDCGLLKENAQRKDESNAEFPTHSGSSSPCMSFFSRAINGKTHKKSNVPESFSFKSSNGISYFLARSLPNISQSTENNVPKVDFWSATEDTRAIAELSFYNSTGEEQLLCDSTGEGKTFECQQHQTTDRNKTKKILCGNSFTLRAFNFQAKSEPNEHLSDALEKELQKTSNSYIDYACCSLIHGYQCLMSVHGTWAGIVRYCNNLTFSESWHDETHLKYDSDSMESTIKNVSFLNVLGKMKRFRQSSKRQSTHLYTLNDGGEKKDVESYPQHLESRIDSFPFPDYTKNSTTASNRAANQPVCRSFTPLSSSEVTTPEDVRQARDDKVTREGIKISSDVIRTPEEGVTPTNAADEGGSNAKSSAIYDHVHHRASPIRHQYCVVGAGPAGLQLGYFLGRSRRDYVIFERANRSGSFFERYPRHRTLISINKRFTGRTNPEFNLRHDWNSLLSDDPSLLYRHFSKDFFPHADSMVEYLNTYAQRLKLNIQYNTDVNNIRRHDESSARDGAHFSMTDQRGRRYECKVVVAATGLWVPNAPLFPGHQLTEGYEDVAIDSRRYEGKTVLILGRGNAAFETADAIYGVTNNVHMVSRSRARLAWSTHYVGDLRAINNGLLDTYQLKSLDGLLEANVEDLILQKAGRKVEVMLPWDAAPHLPLEEGGREEETPSVQDDSDEDNFSLREGYDYVIRCLGFKFDFSIFNKAYRPCPSPRLSKYPSLKSTYESSTVPDLFFAGTATHSLDFRRSAGGFIHGFRYAVQALHRMLEWRYHGNPWLATTHHTRDLLNVIISRINQASGPYQMFGALADLFFLQDSEVTLLEEVPLALVGRLEAVTGRRAKGALLVLIMEYGQDFSGPDKDPFRTDRAAGDVLEAHHSNFLHPVLYYYSTAPDESAMIKNWGKTSLPRPDKIHHVLEDFLTDWTAQQSHVLPLRRFLESVLDQDLRQHFAQDCVLTTLTSAGPPLHCQDISAAPYFIPPRLTANRIYI